MSADRSVDRHQQDAHDELDDVDKAVIRHLQVDGRLSYAELGPMVGLSQAAVRQRVKRLTDRGVIQVVAVTDPRRLGLDVQAMVAIDVDGDVCEVADRLAEIDEVDYVVIVAGRYDIMCEVVCATTDDLLRVTADQIRAVDGVRRTELLSYLRLVKQTYSWGTG